ncbi:MAG: efflux RND transporter periplasmic adaptor subunit [Acidobacteria bacterium]|nr:efflux RND transporter periplasmic adaptor subunit [Acidobacteriota bacterium]
MKSAIGCGAAILAILAAGCGREAERTMATAAAASPAGSSQGRVVLPPGSPKLERIRVAAVHTAQFPCEEVTAPAKVEVNPNRISRVLMPVAGRVRQVHVRLGDAVTEGQTLVAIDSPEASAAVAACRQAQSQLRQTRSALDKAQADSERARDLYEHRAAALKDVLEARNELAQSQAGLDQAQAASDSALHHLAVLGLKPEQTAPEVLVRAPFSGKILDIAVAAGEYRTDTNTPLMTVVDLSTVWVAADVPESSIRLIRVGEPVQVEMAAYPGEVLRGRVMRIADTVDAQTRTIKVQTELQNRDGRLRPEMFGRIRHTHGSCTVRVTQASAILHGDAGPFVFVERAKGDFSAAPIRVGETRDGMAVLLSGPQAGDRVVVEGAILLSGR